MRARARRRLCSMAQARRNMARTRCGMDQRRCFVGQRIYCTKQIDTALENIDIASAEPCFAWLPISACQKACVVTASRPVATTPTRQSIKIASLPLLSDTLRFLLAASSFELFPGNVFAIHREVQPLHWRACLNQ